jgi:polysaccharide chain length determinant protein (PEP-CTERM system associated)
MLGHREMTIDDYLAIARRRKWIILIPVLLCPIVTFVASLFITDEYTSRTLVLVEQQKVPDSIVQPVVGEDISQRLATMQEQIMSRTRLQPIIEKFNLYQGGANTMHMEDKVETLRRAITIEPVRSLTGPKGGALPGFFITFTAGDPQLAQRVCAEITSMFIEENLRAREQRSQGTTDFLANQLAEAKRKLDETDAQLAQFKSKYFGSLPGQEQTNISMLQTLNSQLESANQAMARAQQEKTYAESLLAQQLAALESTPAGPGGVAQPDLLQAQMVALQNNLIAAQARYTDDHPDVIKLKKDIAKLQQEIDAQNRERATAPAPGTETRPVLRETPQIQQLRAQIQQANLTIQARSRDVSRLQGQIGLYQSRLSLSPAVEQQFKELTRDYTTALQFYNDLLAKEAQSKMATNLERRQQGEQFRVMDPANLPQSPSFPNRPLFAAGGLGLGLAIGIGISLLLEMKDKTLRTESDIKFFLQAPTLALIPISSEILNGKKSLWSRLRRKRARPQVGVEA